MFTGEAKANVMATAKSKPKPKLDPEFTKLLGNHLLNAKGFYEYGVERGLMTPESLRLTIEKRQETAKALIANGVSQRKVAKALGVSKGTIQNDVSGQKLSKNGQKVSTRKSSGKKSSNPREDEAAIDYRKQLLNLASKAETAGYNFVEPKMTVFGYAELVEHAKNVITIWQRIVKQYEELAKNEKHISVD